MPRNEKIAFYQARRKSVMNFVGYPAGAGVLIFILSINLNWSKWIAIVAFAVSFVSAIAIPFLVRCPFCRKSVTEDDYAGMNPATCPHCKRSLK